jgi:hypothetical protein
MFSPETLDPVVHADRVQKNPSASPIEPSFRMDYRIKSDNDEAKNESKGSGTPTEVWI